MSENVAKLTVSALGAGIVNYFSQIRGVMIILIAVMIIDYLSGVAAAWKAKELSSKTGLVGILKKTAYLAVVAVGITVDVVIMEMAETIGWDMEQTFFMASMVAVWMIINECISILENADKLGAPVPGFLTTIIDRLKQKTEEKIPSDKN